MKSVTFSPGSNCLLVSLSCSDKLDKRERGRGRRVVVKGGGGGGLTMTRLVLSGLKGEI